MIDPSHSSRRTADTYCRIRLSAEPGGEPNQSSSDSLPTVTKAFGFTVRMASKVRCLAARIRCSRSG